MSDTPRTDALYAGMPMPPALSPATREALDLARQLEREVAELREALEPFVMGKVRFSAAAVHPSGLFCDVCGLNSEVAVHSRGCPVARAAKLLEPCHAQGGV